MYYRYSTALSHIILTLTNVYCLKKEAQFNVLYIYQLSATIIILVNSLSGIWKWGNPANGYTSNKIYNCSRSIQNLFLLPLVVTELWIKYNLPFVYIHLVFAFILYIALLKKRHLNDKFLNVFIAFNILSCFSLSFKAEENYFVFSLGISYFINHFILRDGSEIFDMPTIDFHNYALCFFSYFSLKAVQYD